MGHFTVDNYLEAKQLNLGTEHFPFPCTLGELVLDRYDDSPAPVNSANTLELEEILGYLENVDNFDLSPLMGIMTQTEAMGDPAMPSKEQSAILLWLGKALEQWEKEFPLEEPLASYVKRIKPVAAAQAITDPTFLQPGAHPIHQLLDAIQARAVGWQSELDRVAAILEQQVTKAIDKTSAWFQNHNTDIEDICAEFVAAAERDNARAQRMIQRVVETELGKVKTAAAKFEAAHMINTLLEQYDAPAEIGEFLKGPWYSSAQLVLLKFSQDSEQWRQMSETTHTLLDSLQPMEEGDEERKQLIFEVVTRLPKEMRRWLLSLHHDTEAVNEAMGLVEFAHLRILRNQALKIQKIQPVPTVTDPALSGNAQPSDVVIDFDEGQWFLIDSPDNGEIRVQLVLKVEREEQLLFANMAGIKVMQLSFAEFGELLAKGKVAALDFGASFSRCLAQAAGIKSTAMLDALAKTQGAPEKWREGSPSSAEDSPRKPELELVSSQEAPLVEAGLQDPGSEEESYPTPDTQAATSARTSTDTELSGETTIDVNASESDEQAFLEMLDDELLDDFGQEVDNTQEVELAETIDNTSDAEFLSSPASIEPVAGSGHEAALEQATEPDATGAPTAAEGTGFLLDQSQQLANDAKLSTPEQIDLSASTPAPEPVPAAPEQAAAPASLDLPSGTWLGFHDGETPLMARLAVHDPDEDQYIFVNRKGVKLRTTTGAELASLIEEGLVDILETKSNFRDEVQKARDDLDT